MYATHLSTIQHLQNLAQRLLFSSFMFNASSLHCSHGILSAQKLVKYFMGTLYYKYVNGKLRNPLLNSSQFPQVSSTHFAKANNFYPSPGLIMANLSQNFRLSLWNPLPLEIKNRSLDMFKNAHICAH